MSNSYEVRGVPHFNGGMYGVASPVTKVEADFYNTYEGQLDFYYFDKDRNEIQVASFAPGRWDNVLKVEPLQKSGYIG